MPSYAKPVEDPTGDRLLHEEEAEAPQNVWE